MGSHLTVQESFSCTNSCAFLSPSRPPPPPRLISGLMMRNIPRATLGLARPSFPQASSSAKSGATVWYLCRLPLGPSTPPAPSFVRGRSLPPSVCLQPEAASHLPRGLRARPRRDRRQMHSARCWWRAVPPTPFTVSPTSLSPPSSLTPAPSAWGPQL